MSNDVGTKSIYGGENKFARDAVRKDCKKKRDTSLNTLRSITEELCGDVEEEESEKKTEKLSRPQIKVA